MKNENTCYFDSTYTYLYPMLIISGKNPMFNKTTHPHINIVTRVKEMRTYHVDVPIGLVLDILDVSTLKKAHIHKRFTGCGNTYRLDGTRLIPTSLDKEYVTNAN